MALKHQTTLGFRQILPNMFAKKQLDQTGSNVRRLEWKIQLSPIPWEWSNS